MARTAAMNQEIKRVLTEVLLKVHILQQTRGFWIGFPPIIVTYRSCMCYNPQARPMVVLLC